MLTHYYTIKENGAAQIERKKSLFNCQLFRIESEEEAKALLQDIKKENWKATHNCSAFVLGEHQTIQRSSDDGEPSGTAGTPILEVLKKNDLYNVLAIVTRYFGGTKLGSGGLIRAYSQAVSNAIEQVGLVEGRLQKEVHISLHYPLLGKLENWLESSSHVIKRTVYTDNVTVTCLVDIADQTGFQQTIIDLLNNQCTFETGATQYHEEPLKSARE